MQHTDNRACARVCAQKDRLRSLQRGDCVCTFLTVCVRARRSPTQLKRAVSHEKHWPGSRITRAPAHAHTQTRINSHKPPPPPTELIQVHTGESRLPWSRRGSERTSAAPTWSRRGKAFGLGRCACRLAAHLARCPRQRSPGAAAATEGCSGWLAPNGYQTDPSAETYVLRSHSCVLDSNLHACGRIGGSHY